MPKLLKCAQSPSPDHNLLSPSEMMIEDLDIHGDENFDANAQATADDEWTTFYLEQLEKERSGSFGLSKKKLMSCME
jgi:hypothetical protein